MKRIYALLSAALILALTLSSCAGGSKPAVGTDATTAPSTEGTEGSTDLRALYPAPEAVDYEGYDFRMMSQTNLAFQQTEYYAEEQTGDLLNDTIYTRNRTIEDKYNIEISYIEQSDVTGTIRKAVQAGDDFADIVLIQSINDQFVLAQQNFLLDLYTLDPLDLSNPWYDSRYTDGLTVNGKIFGITGDFNMNDKLREMSVTYNKKLYEEYAFENPYELVNSGKWTFAKMKEMSKAVTKDLDGDGKLGILDQWGLMTEKAAGWYIYLASGNKSIKNENGVYTVDIGGERMYNIFDDILALVSDKNISICMDDGSVKTDLADVWKEATRMYINNQALFRTGTFGDTVDLRNMETDFGVLPIPKYDEVQDAYYCMVQSDCRPVSIPATVPDPDRTATIFNALAYESMFTVRPAFYETFLDQKILRDEESTAMVDILFASKLYDLDFYCSITGLSGVIGDIVGTGNNTLASKTAAIEDSAQIKLDKFIEKFSG